MRPLSTKTPPSGAYPVGWRSKDSQSVTGRTGQGSALHLPERAGERRELASASEVMGLAGNQVHCGTALRIEMGVAGRSVGVDGDQDTLPLTLALKDELFGLDHHVAVAAVAQRFAGAASGCQPGNPPGQGIFLRRLNGGAQ